MREFIYCAKAGCTTRANIATGYCPKHRDSDAARRAETTCSAPVPQDQQARCEAIAQVHTDIITQQFNRWSHLLKAGEQAKQFNRETGAAEQAARHNSR